LVLGYLVYAETVTLTQDPVAVQSVYVFPGRVTADGWRNLSTITTQNADEEALYQDFNQINSAYIDGSWRRETDRTNDSAPAPAPEPDTEPESATTTAVVATTTPALDEPTDEVVVPDTATATPATVPDEAEETEVPPSALLVEPEPEAPVDTATSSAVETSFRQIERAFRYTVSTVTSWWPFMNAEATTTSVTVEEDAAEIIITEPASDPVVTTEVVETATPTTTPPTATATSTDDSAPATTTEPVAAPVATSSATTSAVVPDEPAPTEVPDSDPVVPVLEPVSEGVAEHDPYTIRLERFGLPLFDETTRLGGAQLRMSFAAKRKDTRDTIQSLSVHYSRDDGATFSDAGSVIIEDEASNSLNGGYYLFSLPAVTEPADLDRLVVELRYPDDPEALVGIYVDAVWLEVLAVVPSAEEPTDPVADFDDNFQSEPLSGDALTLPNGETVIFDFTDENSGETLIIKSDEVTYEGLTKATTYFNVTNESNRTDEFTVKTYFPESLGSVESLEEWRPNRPRQVTVPEFRPFVYHCEGGWEETDSTVGTDLQFDISDLIEPPAPAPEPEGESVATTSVVATTTPAVEEIPEVEPSVSETATTSISEPVGEAEPLVQASSISPSESDEIVEVEPIRYQCGASTLVRTCDYLSEDGTECWNEAVRVEEHELKAYRPGWEPAAVASSTGRIGTGFLTRAASLVGLAPRVKDVPDEFIPKTVTPETFTIRPGETRYFKMEVSFPPFTDGEFWIEAIGNREYGLLDPFWSSSWEYRLPLTIDNVGQATSTEQQVFLELNASSSADFWSNVKSDGGDVRFIQETPGNEADWFDASYSNRQLLPVTIGTNRPDGGYDGYTVRATLDTATLVGNTELLSNCNDLRVVYQSGATTTELDRLVTDCNTATTTVAFALQADHATSTTVNDYYLYYNYSSAGAPPADAEQVFLWYDDVSSNRLSSYTNDRGDAWLSTGTSNSAAYNAGGYYTFDTGDNFNESLRIPSGTLSERDVYFEAEWFIDTCYPNNVGFGNYARYLGETSYYATERSEASLSGCDAGGYGNDGDIVKGAFTTAVVDGTNPGDLAGNQWRRVAIAAWGINPTNLSYWDIDDTSTEAVTGFTDAAVHVNGTEAAGTDIESSGEVGIQAAQVGGRLRNLVARRYVEPEPSVAADPVEAFTPTTFSELDYWIQHWDGTGEEADIWVQVDELAGNASTTIYLYYGNSSADTTSDAYAPFTYSTTTPLYHVVDDSTAETISVVSLIDNNEVSLDGGAAVSLEAGERTTFSTFTATSVLSVLGPVSATVSNNDNNDGSETMVPIGFATTSFAFPTNRGSSVFYAYAPFASTTVDFFTGSAGTPDQTLSVATSTVGTSAGADPGGGEAAILEATSPILATHRSSDGTANDGLVGYEPTLRDLFGFYSNQTYLTALADNPDPSTFCSGGDTGSETGITRGEQQAISNCSNGAQMIGNGVRFTGQTTPLVAIQQADADGNESTMFWPELEFSTHYAMSNDTQFVAAICSPRFGSVTLEVQSPTGTTTASGTCVPGADSPGALHFGDSGTNSNVSYTAGHQIVSTNGVPFYAVYEDVSIHSDEKNVLGQVQARKYNALNRSVSFGAQEVNNDARWVQQSFLWYENIDAITPTSTWPLADGEQVDEGEAITGGGAIEVGDELRLRLNVEATVATGTINSTAFRLQYAAAPTCSAAGTNDWVDVGAIGSTTAAFAGFNNASVTDETTLSSTTLASSTVFGTYEEENDSRLLPTQVGVGELIEYDWVLTTVNPILNAEYCFRMVRDNGQPLNSYTTYPELVVAGPPLAPTHQQPFDNEHEPSLTPLLQFFTTDISGDDLHFEVEIDDDPDFSSPAVDRNSETNGLDFVNLNDGGDKQPFDSGAPMQFTTPTSLSASTTYWWRVRAKDPDGSNTYGDWSTNTSFTTNQSVTVSEWFQTTGDQFATNNLTGAATSSGGVSVASSPATILSTTVNFNDASVGNAWGSFDWDDTITSGSASYQILYNTGTGFAPIPESDLPGNSTGFTSGPVNLLDLDTETYAELQLQATLTGTVTLNDWTLTWGQRVDIPTLIAPFDHELEPDSTPALTFTTTDPQGDALVYEVSYSTTSSFTASTTVTSSSSVAFANLTNPPNPSPFNSGDTITYTFPSALTASTTYWWRVRAIDPSGGNNFSPWSEADSFTIGTTTVSTWYQTTPEQFETGALSGVVASTSGSVEITNQIGEYGQSVVDNGTWTEIVTQRTYSDPVVVASVRYTPTGDTERSARVNNKTANSFEVMVTNFSGLATGTTTVDWLVMERGDWTLEDGSSGTRLIADTFTDVSDVQSSTYAASGYGEDVAFSPSFGSTPAVIGTISSDPDGEWAVVGLNDGNTRDNPPTGTGMGIYLGRSTTNSAKAPADVDYVVMAAGHGTNNGSEFDAEISLDAHDEPPVTAELFSSAFSSAPQVVLVQQAAEQGGQGGWAGLYAATPPTTDNYYPFIDEDGSADRAHTPEPVFVIAFEDASGTLVRQGGGGDLSGTVVSEPITFSDGTGPKFGELSFNDTTAGASSITYQVEQYSTSTGWELVPDSDIPGNSVGTSTSPIDLSQVDVSTHSQIRVRATLECSGGDCPTLDEWSVTWAEGVEMNGTIKEYDRLTNVASGSVRAYVNNVLVSDTGTITNGTWSISNVTAFAGNTITVFVDGAAEADEAVASFVYDGVGDITGVEMFEQHLAISAPEGEVVTNDTIGQLDYTASLNDEDIFHEVDGNGNLTLCAQGTCSGANLYVGPGNTYIPSATTSATTTVHDLVNDGTVELDNNVLLLSGSWDNNSVVNADTSTVRFTASVTDENLSDQSGTLTFHHLAFDSGVGTSTWAVQNNLDLSGDLTVESGTLNRTSFDIDVAGDVTTGSSGLWNGYGTTTFDGTTAATWSDQNATTQNIGNVIVDGSLKTVTVTSDVGATDITIGADDTLNAGGANTIYVAGDWTATGSFVAQTSEVRFIDDINGYRIEDTVPSDWLNDEWEGRVPLTIAPGTVSATLSNFPVYLDLATLGTDFWSNVRSDGGDIRVTAADGTSEVPVEVVSIDTGTEVGEVHFRAGSISDTATTTFYVYFDNPATTTPAATATYGSQNVWSNNYRAVYHFEGEGQTGRDNLAEYTDSTANGFDAEDDTLANGTTGLVGDGVEFSDANVTGGSGEEVDHIQLPIGIADGLAELSYTVWYQTTNTTYDHTLLAGYSGENEIISWITDAGSMQYYVTNSAETAFPLSGVSVNPEDGSWHQYVYIRDHSLDRVQYYADGSFLGNSTGLPGSSVNLTGGGFNIGKELDSGADNINSPYDQSLDGFVDEVRFASVARSADWIAAEYDTLFDPTSFYATGTAETLALDGNETPSHLITTGSDFYQLTFADATTSASFLDVTVTATDNVTIATGTVTFPTGNFNVGGSFQNTGGTFSHNNGTVVMTGSGTETIEQQGTTFLNAFYDLRFTGSGNWSYLDTNATTSNEYRIENGSVTFPSGQLTVGGDFTVSGSGGFTHNNGEVVFETVAAETITANGSSFYDIRVIGAGNTGWYGTAWQNRIPITISASAIDEPLSNFPVYVNLADLGSTFWSGVQSDGRDLRMTTADGVTELPLELVAIDTGSETGELHFRADTIASSTDTVFYMYFDNPAATTRAVDDPLGRNAVWSNGYEAVFHLEESGTGALGEYVDATGNGYDAQGGSGVAGQVPATATGRLGSGQDFENGGGGGTEDFIDLNVALPNGFAAAASKSVSAWVNVESFSDTGGVWHMGGNVTGSEFTMRKRNGSGLWTAQHDDGPNYNFTFGAESQWLHLALDYDGSTSRAYGNGALQASEASTLSTADVDGTGVLIGRWRTGSYFDGVIDEVRFASTERSVAWYRAEFVNQATSTDFYATSSAETVQGRIFSETTATASGSVTLDGGNTVMPSDTLFVGGSFDNNSVFSNNGGTILFDATSSTHTIAAGVSSFASVVVDSSGGTYSVSENATSTALWQLTDAAAFTVPGGVTLGIAGTFSNALPNASTTWLGSTILFTGSDHTVNTSSSDGDEYGTLITTGDTDVRFWNSEATAWTTEGTGSFYSQDHDNNDGDLYIFGNYDGSGPSEYWSYATDFDGTDLSGGSERPVTVSVASSSVLTLTAGLEAIGTSSASTTVRNQTTGTFTWVQSSSTVAAQYLAVTDTDSDGWQLTGTTDITSFNDVAFTTVGTSSALTVAAETLNLNPTTIFERVTFTSSAGTPTNVTLLGVPGSYWRFSSGSGDRYGEAFDNDDGDPGAIQWDDSQFSSTVAGTVYADDGVTPMGAPVCDGVSPVVTVVVNASSTFQAACSPADGSYRVAGVTYQGEPAIMAYLDLDQTATDPVSVTVRAQSTGTGDVLAGESVSIPRPTVADGDLLVMIFGQDDEVGGITTPAGWSVGAELAGTTGDDKKTSLWYRPVVDASQEPASYVVASNDTGTENYSYWIASLTGVDLADPIDDIAGWDEFTTVTADAPSVTTTVDNSLVLATWYVTDDTDVTPPGAPWSVEAEDIRGTENNLTVVSQLVSPSGATGVATLTGIASGDDTSALQAAFKRASYTTGTTTAAVVTKTPVTALDPSLAGVPFIRDSRQGIVDVVAAGTLSVPLPGALDDDVLVVAIGKDDEFTISPPAGWTEIGSQGVTGGNDLFTGIWYRAVSDVSSEPATYSFTSNDGSTEDFSYWIGAFGNVDTASPIEVTGTWSDVVNGGTENDPIEAPSVTTVNANTLAVAVWFASQDADLTLPGSSWTTVAEDIQNNGRNLNLASQVISSPGATGAASLSGLALGVDGMGIQFGLRSAGPDFSSIVGFDLYANQLITRHENSGPLTIADLVGYDNADDSDIPFTAATSSADTLTVLPGNGLYIFGTTTFTPGGEVTLTGGGTGASDGSLTVGPNATFVSTGAETHVVGGSLYVDSGGTFTPASSLVTFTSTTTGRTLAAAASSTVNFNELQFTGSGGWQVLTPIVAATDVTVASGTLSGISDVTLTTGSLSGNGVVGMTGGTVTINRANTLGGTNPWSFYNLTLGDGINSEITTPAGAATTTVRNTLTIATGHFLDAGSAVFDLAGSGTVLVEDGSFLEDTSTIRYSGNGAVITGTPYYNLVVDTATGTAVATAPPTGLQVLNDLTVGSLGTSTLNLTTNDPLTSVAGDLFIGPNSTLAASDSSSLQLFGSYDNNGVFTANGGLVDFAGTGSSTIAAGTSPFADVTITGTGDFTVTEHATATGLFTIGGSPTFTLDSGQSLAVGGQFSNQADGADTNWTGSTLSLFGGQAYQVGGKSLGDTYATVQIAAGTHPRFWNSTFGSVVTETGGSLYSMDHENVTGDLYIFGDYVNSSFDDDWSYATDWDGVMLGSPRQADVYITGGGSVTYTGGSLAVVGSSSATTTIQNQGSGTYELTVGGTATTEWQYAAPRDVGTDGIVLTGTPDVTDLAHLDFLAETNGATTMTVYGTVIDANPAKNLNLNSFNSAGGVTGATNVTATGTTVSSWRFANHNGNLDGESNDNDSGNPGEIVWDDSDAVITVSGRVYSDEGSTVSGVCDGGTNNILLRVAGLTTYTGSCNATTGLYSIPGVAFSPSDTLTVYIDNEVGVAGAAVTIDPISTISNLDIYEDRVIVRHEGTDPIAIADMAVWDSSDDGDIPFTAVTGSPDTLSLPTDTKLIVWDNKDFAPDGNITLANGPAAYAGTLEAYDGATFTTATGESHSIGGELRFGTGAVFTDGGSTITLTTSGSGRTVDVNEGDFTNLIFNGSGSWNVTDTTLTATGDVTVTAGAVTLPSATTTVGGSFENTGGSFVASGGLLNFTSSSGGETVRFGGSDAAAVRFSGSGAWSFADTNATTTAAFTVSGGTVTLPSGVLAVGAAFVNTATITHSGGTVAMTASSGSHSITLSGSDLTNLHIVGAGSFTMTDGSAALLGDLTVAAGALTTPTSTLALGGSLDATGGSLSVATSTVLFNSSDGGETVNPGSNNFHNVVVNGVGGGWTFAAATTTGNFSLTNATSFTLQSGATLAVGGVFQNSVGGANTTWSGTTLALTSGTDYSVNTKSAGGDVYGTVVLSGDTDVRFWNSSYATTSLTASDSVYSQDHGASDGALNIYGAYEHGTTTEYWSYATDFDGTALGGSGRAVSVTLIEAATSSFSMTSGALEIIGQAGASTTITSDAGTYSFAISGGSLDANYYEFTNLDVSGLNLSGTTAITSLSDGSFAQAVNSASLLTLATETLDANAGLTIERARFTAEGLTGGVNVNLAATSTNSWQFVNHSGDLSGEAYDTDGTDNCGSVRWDDSDCLLIEQTEYRWRNDDGGLGVPSSEWWDSDWDARQAVRVFNNDNQAYSTTTVKVTVPYDADMQSDFDDLRFTADDGVTLVPHWTERVVANTTAEVWVQVPTLPASDTATLFMYYNNVTASSTSSSTATFAVIEAFESTVVGTDYVGDTNLFTIDGSFAYGGSSGLDTTGFETSRATDGIGRTDLTVSQGEIIRWRQYIDTSSGSNDEICTLFAVQGSVTNNQNYGVCTTLFGTDRLTLVQDAESTDTFGGVVQLASTTLTYTTGWYEVEVDWQVGGQIDVSLFNPVGTLVATTSAADTTYSSGGIGFTYWGQHGGWDSYHSRPRVATAPTVRLGAEQTEGGATWNALQNTAANNVTIGEPLRLRVAIENTGLDLTGQLFELEYAARGAAPTCEAVSGGSYTTVPPSATCGSEAICMATSTHLADGDSTVDLLLAAEGAFTAGRAIEDPSNQTSAFAIDQSEYSEFEYVLTPTVNVSSEAYCLRVTNDGTPLDAYGKVAELALEYTPTLGAVSLNGGEDIDINLGATTTVMATATVTDLNGFADLAAATTTFYRSGVGPSCTPDDNNCYLATSTACSFTDCSGNSCTLACAADFWYHVDPTDSGSAFDGEEWYAFMEVEDAGGNSDFGTSVGLIDVLTMLALDVVNEINYGTLDVNQDTGSFNPITTIQNLGNDAFDVNVVGTDLTDGGVSVIPANQQLFATSTFTYSSCTTCATLSATGTSLELDLIKPTSSLPYLTDDIYWGIEIPFGTASNPHTGNNTFYAVGD
jgi:hypothetical protein